MALVAAGTAVVMPGAINTLKDLFCLLHFFILDMGIKRERERNRVVLTIGRHSSDCLYYQLRDLLLKRARAQLLTRGGSSW